MYIYVLFFNVVIKVTFTLCRDEDKISKACYWPNEVYEPCFGGCAEVSCDNPINHLRPCYPYCEPGCVCEDPYVRDDRTHHCVLPHNCSPTQMGIPYQKGRQLKPTYSGKIARAHSNHEEFNENDAMSINRGDDVKGMPEQSRMGNYFNIVIAPPPIKALQPRKTLISDSARLGSKKYK